MREDILVPPEQRPTVLVVANPSGLSLSVVEQLISSFCKVEIVTNLQTLWNKSLSHIGKSADVKIFSFDEENLLGDFDQAILVSDTIEGKESIEEERKRFSFLKKQIEKRFLEALLVLPGVIFSKTQEKVFEEAASIQSEMKDSVGSVYVGEVLGPRASFSQGSFLGRALEKYLQGTKVTVPNSETTSVNVSLAAREIVKLLFSFGGVGGEVFLYSHEIKAEMARDLFLSLGSKDVAIEQRDEPTPHIVSVQKRKLLTSSLLKDFEDTTIWFRNHPQDVRQQKDIQKTEITKIPTKPKKEDVVVKKIQKVPRTLKGKPISGSFKLIISLLILFVISPFLFMFSSGVAAYVAAKSIETKNPSVTRSTSLISRALAKVSSRQLSLFSKTPFIGKYFNGALGVSNLLINVSGTISRASVIYGVVSELASGILGEESYDLTSLERTLSLELAVLYEETGFIEGEIADRDGVVGFFSEKVLGGRDLGELREKILAAERFSSELSWLLGGEGEERKYLVLFQNNMELRPTGGFIGSFGLVGLKDGKLTEIEVQDVYSADGQLKGHVEPPAPVKEYLGEANWYLRDSNWDPDFPVSAERAEWFLDKEIGVAVDGVITIDLEVARKLVEVTGGIRLEDFGQEITSENLYEITQYEAEEEFFPGSRKKASFLTALSRELLFTLRSSPENKHQELAKKTYSLLEGKHVQIFLHNTSAQRAISSLAWDGSVYQPMCTGNCYADYFGIAEANVGVNKANYFIQRSADFISEVGESGINRSLSVSLTNSANPALGTKGNYKNYLRVIAPLDANFSDVIVQSSNNQEVFEPEIVITNGRKEAGILVEVAPGQSRKIVFTWSSPISISFSTKGEYRFVWRKQAGTLEDSIKASVVLPEGVLIKDAGLTASNEALYNTTLARDFSSRIFW